MSKLPKTKRIGYAAVLRKATELGIKYGGRAPKEVVKNNTVHEVKLVHDECGVEYRWGRLIKSKRFVLFCPSCGLVMKREGDISQWRSIIEAKAM